jgi:hypothetical protein
VCKEVHLLSGDELETEMLGALQVTSSIQLAASASRGVSDLTSCTSSNWLATRGASEPRAWDTPHGPLFRAPTFIILRKKVPVFDHIVTTYQVRPSR